MGVLNIKLQAVDDATTLLREKAMQLRQIQRAAERLGFEDLGSELGDIADTLVDESKRVDKAVGVIVSEFMSEVKKEPAVEAAAAGQAD